MKPVIKIISFILLAGVFLYISYKKKYSCEGCSDINNNKPPIAVAGPDLVITLPTDSVSLDGSASDDPGGTISEWPWTKISGPASFTITNVTGAKQILRIIIEAHFFPYRTEKLIRRGGRIVSHHLGSYRDGSPDKGGIKSGSCHIY